MKFKGHTTIELKNVETGEVKKYEDDNMITNAISKLLNFAATHALGTSSLNIYSSHWYNLLGGLVLFDTALTENADAIYPPAGTKPKGYGMVGDTNSYTSVPEWGIYNTQESNTSATDTKTMVWDFSTSHGNGTIASVALTHRNAGLFGFGIENYVNTQRTVYGRMALGTMIVSSSKGVQGRNDTSAGVVGSNLSLNDGSYVDFCIDSANDQKYQFKVCADGISIITHKLYPEQMDVYQGATAFQSYEEDTYAGTFSGTYFYHFYNPDEKVLYFWTTSSTVNKWENASLSLAIHKYDVVNETLTANWKTFSNSSRSIYNNFVVTSSAIYFVRNDASDNKWKISKHDLTSGTVTDCLVFSSLTFETYGCEGRKSYIRNGLVYFPHAVRYDNYLAYTVIVDTSDDSVRYTNITQPCYYYNQATRNGVCVPPYDNTQVACGAMLNSDETLQQVLNLQQYEGNTSTIGNVYADVCYLGTINNLSEPIVKNAQQTMKITYTITVEEEE